MSIAIGCINCGPSSTFIGNNIFRYKFIYIYIYIQQHHYHVIFIHFHGCPRHHHDRRNADQCCRLGHQDFRSPKPIYPPASLNPTHALFFILISQTYSYLSFSGSQESIGCYRRQPHLFSLFTFVHFKSYQSQVRPWFQQLKG